MLVKEIMTKEVKYVEPEQTIKEVAELMRKHDIGALPVGENDRLVGMITDRDIVIRAISKGSDPATTKVRDVMTPKCLYCLEEQTIEELGKNVSDNQLHRMPVLNKDKRMVGIVSLADLSIRGSSKVAGDALHHISENLH